MNRRTFLKRVFTMAATPILLAACGAASDPPATVRGMGGPGVSALEKPLAEWRQLLPANVYGVLFEENTELPFSSPLLDEHGEGTFLCAACGLPLFSSTTKYESGTGWPSFFESLPNRVGTREDFTLIAPRTEYHCLRCGGHQGHLFDDGPAPTGKRYCNNGLALQFVAEGQTLPDLRS